MGRTSTLIKQSVPLLALIAVMIIFDGAHAASGPFDDEGRLICDDIVVGAGTGGCPLAESLSRNPDNIVCLFEAGVDNYDEFKNEAVIAYKRAVPKYPHGLRSQYSTEPENPYLSSLLQVPPREVVWGRGFGGGLAYVAGTFHRPPPWDFERWNSSFWTFESTAADWREIETYSNAYNASPDPAVHGTSGPVHVTAFELQDTDWLIANATMNFLNIGFQTEPAGLQNPTGLHSSPRPAWKAQPTDTKLTRQDMCSTFLSDDVISSRPNLIIMINSEVTRIDFKTQGGKIRANSVEYYTAGRKRMSAQVRNSAGEVFITAGAINTPAVLMRSGVGNCDNLATFGIECVLNNPHVGRNLRLNIQKGISYISPFLPPPGPNDPDDGAIATYYARSNFADPTSPYPDGEIAFTGVYEPQFNLWVYLFAALTHEPSSLGYVELVSSNPFEHPNIVTNAARNVQDTLALADHLLRIRAIMATIECPIGPNITTPCFIEQGSTLFVPNSVGAAAQWLVSNAVLGHKFGTAALKLVVEEESLRVIGLDNVRVCDNSVVPANPVAHSNSATAAIVGKRCGTIVLEERGWNV